MPIFHATFYAFPASMPNQLHALDLST
ncbi:hypothetical protein C362_01452 [Cryptococcus neoformans Bt1]|nr:hypothetical protein C362_01452 [Cryptococcus neoformans var. grubii Bt1]OXH02636.1 hypothetical protein C369_06168 [Cryptococcus neoformans var. grubii A5-35-17]OXH04161.1 hypothetical protein C370_06250 [Cryptococcus neoformans var. grubii A1-35-8]